MITLLQYKALLGIGLMWCGSMFKEVYPFNFLSILFAILFIYKLLNLGKEKERPIKP